jgi:hypothetical protein
VKGDTTNLAVIIPFAMAISSNKPRPRIVATGVNYPNSSTVDGVSPVPHRFGSKHGLIDKHEHNKVMNTEKFRKKEGGHLTACLRRRNLIPDIQGTGDTPLEAKSTVKYDMNLVPPVKKSYGYLKDLNNRLEARSLEKSSFSSNDVRDESKHIDICQPSPFLGNNVSLWIPASRGEWEDSITEMVAVCKVAALRRHSSASENERHAPLSHHYIRDRVEIDDPLFGYQIRHSDGGWLQGFILFTSFTTWSHYFRWDSLHEASGIHDIKSEAYAVDSDGSLAAALEQQERAGDPTAGGVVFPSIAEISLIGGLGCGEYLLRLALDDIQARKCYKFVVLQATDSSRTFYEKFGFIRVGAVSRYGKRGKGRQPLDRPATLSDLVGYRHWTYAHESEKTLRKHGGPSYMMALSLKPNNKTPCADNLERASIRDSMIKIKALKKPKIIPVKTKRMIVKEKEKFQSSMNTSIEVKPEAKTGTTSRIDIQRDSFQSKHALEPRSSLDSCNVSNAKIMARKSPKGDDFKHPCPTFLVSPAVEVSQTVHCKPHHCVSSSISEQRISLSRKQKRTRNSIEIVSKRHCIK